MTVDVDADVPLPVLHQADLDDATLADLFRDLEALTEIVEIRLKLVSAARAEEGTVSLARARAALSEGNAAGAQIVYRHQGACWIDTLTALAPAKVRLTRMLLEHKTRSEGG